MRGLLIGASIVLTLGLHCKKQTQFQVCDPDSGRFIDDHHYVKSDFINEDQTWNYRQWNEYRRQESNLDPAYNCIPIRPGKSLKERIDEQEEIIDLMK